MTAVLNLSAAGRDPLPRVAPQAVGLSASKLDEAAGKVEGMGKLVGEILASMDAIHHQTTAVPDFAVVRYIEALRDLGENLRGFSRMYSGGNPPQLKREMLMGMIDLLKNKIR